MASGRQSEAGLPDAEAHEDHPDQEPADQSNRNDIFQAHWVLTE